MCFKIVVSMSSGNSTLDRFRFQRILERLENLEGRGTELVTVYIPPSKRVHDVMTDLRNEWGTAVNIKSKTTRKNVQDALTKVMERLKLLGRSQRMGSLFSQALLQGASRVLGKWRHLF